jgi:hypothetical protein
MYKVSMLEPNKTEQTQKLMTIKEIQEVPGGKSALKKCDSYSWSYSSNSSITILRALHFNPQTNDYTVSFLKPGETKQTEQIMKAAEVLTFRGGLEAIENYKQLKQNTEQSCAKVLSVFDYNSVLDNYKVNIIEPEAQKKIQMTMTVSDILNSQGGAKAIANYKKLRELQKKRADLKKEVTTTTAHPTLTPSINIQQLLPTVFENLGPKAIIDYKNLHPTLTPSINIQQLLPAVFENLGPKAIIDYKNLHPTLTPSINIQQLLPTVFENPTLAPPTLTPSINIQQLLSTVFEQPLKNLYIVQFNKDHDNYTVTFNETGKRKKTEKMLTRSELLTKQGELYSL